MGIRVNFSDDNVASTINKGGKAWEFPSKSEPGLMHYVTFINGNINCTCLGWKGHRKCWHTREVLEMFQSDEL